MNIIETLENEQLRKDIPEFRAGDTVRVHVKVVEGKTERIQMFEGVVIAKRNHGLRETFTVRRVSYGVGVERTFLLHSPRLDKIEVKYVVLSSSICVTCRARLQELRKRDNQNLENGDVRNAEAFASHPLFS